MKKPQLGFAARETASGIHKFQVVVYTASRNGEAMTKTYDPHGRLLSEQETKRLGYDTKWLIEQARQKRTGLPYFEWRHNAISYQDLW